MALSQVEYSITDSRIFSSSQSNSIFISVNTNFEEILINQRTGRRHQTRRSTLISPPFLIHLNLCNFSDRYMLTLGDYQYAWLCDILAPEILAAGIDLGLGHNGFLLTMAVTVTYQRRVLFTLNDDEESQRIVELGRIYGDELKSVEMDTEPCSICLENLSGPIPSELTRMTCSHVYHKPCLLEWLKRKNTCPLCRTVLFDG